MGWVPLGSASTAAPARTSARTNSGLTLSLLPSTTCNAVAPSESWRPGSTPLVSAWASATVRPRRTISCRIVVNRSPRADRSMRRPASAPASIRATTMPALRERTPYQSGDAPQGSIGSGSAPQASSSMTSVLPLRAWSKRSRTSSGSGAVHAGRSTPSASSTFRVPLRLSPRSYHGQGPSPFATKSPTVMRDSSVIVLPWSSYDDRNSSSSPSREATTVDRPSW
jgi:hypothetical protein